MRQRLGLLNPYFYVPYAGALLLGGCFLLISERGDALLYINRNHTPFFDLLFYYGTELGNGLFYLLVIILLAFYKYKYALLSAICFSITGALTQFLKKVIFSEYLRPKAFFQGIEDLYFVEGVKIFTKYSFPSGHTATAFSLFCLLALIVPKNKYGLLFIGMALIGGVSRIYLVQHFFVDVYFGSLLGVSVTTIIYYYFKKWNWVNSQEWLNRRLF